MNTVLERLDLSRSTYYYHLKNPPKDRWLEVRPLVHEIFARTPNGMGYRQIALALRNEQGLAVSGKTVLRLMREEGLVCRIRKKRYSSYKGTTGKTAENILNRNFKSIRPLEKLVTDVTEFKIAGKRAYLSPVLDLYNNEVISWSITQSQEIWMISKMIEGLKGRLDNRPVLLHSDQGWQYQKPTYQLMLKELGITQSMSRKATCLDNACIESFFGHLKDEFYRHQRFESFDEFKARLDSYIRYWNTRRYQPKLKGLSPEQYRAQSTSAA